MNSFCCVPHCKAMRCASSLKLLTSFSAQSSMRIYQLSLFQFMVGGYEIVSLVPRLTALPARLSVPVSREPQSRLSPRFRMRTSLTASGIKTSRWQKLQSRDTLTVWLYLCQVWLCRATVKSRVGVVTTSNHIVVMSSYVLGQRQFAMPLH